MTTTTITPAQRSAAKIVGAIYLIAMAASMFSELFVRNRLIVPGNVAQTAKNIIASERLFRLSIALDVATFVICVVLLWGLWVILKPVDANLAALGASLRITENAILAAATLNAHTALKLLTSESLSAMNPDSLYALARMFVGIQGNGLQTGFVFTGLGQVIFSIVWLRSGYVPKSLAILGIVAATLLGGGSLILMIFPEWFRVVGLSYMAPMFFYEVGLGLWLLIKGLKTPWTA